MVFIALLIHRLIQLVTLLVIVHTLLSYFLSPFHPVRQTIDRFVEPMLRPIRRIMPQTGMLDFSPLLLIILLQIVDMLIWNLLT